MPLLGLFINAVSPGQRELVLFPALKRAVCACAHSLALARGEGLSGAQTTFLNKYRYKQ